jgi:hypothetical protein
MKFSGFFCDDIRLEADGKRTFVGVYSWRSIVPKFPHIFPQLCLFVEFDLRTGDDLSKSEIIIFEGDKEIARLPANDVEKIPNGKGKLIGFEVTMSPLVVTEPELLFAVVDIGGVRHGLRHLRIEAKGAVSVEPNVSRLEETVPVLKPAKKLSAARKRQT